MTEPLSPLVAKSSLNCGRHIPKPLADPWLGYGRAVGEGEIQYCYLKFSFAPGA